MDGMPVDEAQAFDEAQKLFFQIPDTMLKCAGIINTNEEEYDACIDMLFKFISRSGSPIYEVKFA
jgi:hypothetical protein